MENFLEIAKQQLSQRFVDAGPESDVLESLLEVSGDYRMELLKWVMKDKKIAFVAPRKRAGLEFVKNAPDEGWKILEELIFSSDPDDRDTAFEILEELNDPRSPKLIKLLLNDEYPSIQFEACDYLSDIFPKDVKRTLKELLKHQYSFVREAAEKRLKVMDKSA
jgi:hypothetical protein